MLTIRKTIRPQVGQEIIIDCLSDIHFNTPDCDKNRFEGLIPWILNRERCGPLAQLLTYPAIDLNKLSVLVKKLPVHPGSLIYLFGGGDYNDPFSPSERAALASAKGGQGMHETTLEMLDQVLKDMTDSFYKVVKPVQHCFLGLLEGHHRHDFFTDAGSKLRGMRSTEYLAQMIGCPYLGDMVVIHLDLAPYNLSFRIHAMHGYGSARTHGAQANKRFRMAEVVADADLYVMGHDNNKMVGSREPLRLGPDGTTAHHKQYFIGAGSFQKGYRLDTPYGGYVERLALPPHMLGINMAILHVEKKKKGYRLDYHVSS